ncbi:phosphoenolpyruvate--protein phosphotransferase [soil metagenome]
MSKRRKLKTHTLSGTPGAGGRGIGRPKVLHTEETVVRPEKIDEEDVQSELALTRQAIKDLIEEFQNLKKVSDEEEVIQVIETQIQVLCDPELNSSIEENILQKKYKAVYAIFSSFNTYIQLLENSDTPWLNERSVDIISIRDQLIDVIRNRRREDLNADDAVVFAVELSPTEMIRLRRFKLAGIVTQKGGLTSHMVILAQALGIPCVIGVEWQLMHPERFSTVLINGDEGTIIFEPTEELKEKFLFYQKEEVRRKKIALEWAEKPDVTRCGSPFTIRGNIEFASELPRLASHGARGVGLLRTETVLFETNDFDIDAQVQFYLQVAEASSSEPVVIRLFDAGGDKLPDNHEKEHNPFLGWRGIRMLLDKPDLLCQQYEAILRVSGQFPGRIKILAPMISHLEQIVESKQILEDVKGDLRNRGIAIDEEIPFGIMIEVPGIAIMAAEAAEMSDFFSIGTNDLTQYMLAVDRGNSKISKLYQSAHPSVWRVIHNVITISEEAGIPLSVCGEMASNPLYAACFLGMGLNDLSMIPNSIPAVKSILCSHNLEDFKSLADDVLSAKTCREVLTVLEAWQKTFHEEEV